MKDEQKTNHAFARSLSNAGLGVTMDISDGTLILARYAVDNLLRQYDLTDEGLPQTAANLLKARYEMDIAAHWRGVKRLEATGNVIGDLAE